MDVADDAVGRVAIFSVGAAAEEPDAVRPAARSPRGGSPTWLSVVVDDRLGAVVLAIALVLVLVLGLRLTH